MNVQASDFEFTVSLVFMYTYEVRISTFPFICFETRSCHREIRCSFTGIISSRPAAFWMY